MLFTLESILLITPCYGLNICVCVSCSVVSDSLQPYRVYPARLLCPWDYPGKNTGVGSHSLLQGIFPTQGLNLALLHCRHILYRLSQPGKPEQMNRWLVNSVQIYANWNILDFIYFLNSQHPFWGTQGSIFFSGNNDPQSRSVLGHQNRPWGIQI